MDYSRIISECVIAQRLSEEEIEKLANIAKPREYSPGDLIIREDDTSCDLFIIYKGRVSVEMKRFPYDAGSQRLNLIKTEGVVGEFSFIDKSRRSANVKAHEDVSCLMLPCEELEALMRSDYKIGYILMSNLARLLCGRIRGANFELRNQLIW